MRVRLTDRNGITRVRDVDDIDSLSDCPKFITWDDKLYKHEGAGMGVDGPTLHFRQVKDTFMVL